MVILKLQREIENIKKASQIAAEVLSIVISKVKPGITTLFLDTIAEALIKKRGAAPGFRSLGYPLTIYTSLNETVVYGRPSKRTLVTGDVVKIDLTVLFNKVFGDTAVTVPVGNVSSEAAKLIKVTRESLYRGIEKAVPGGRLSDISYAIQAHVTQNGYLTVEKYGGHGIGRVLHEEPHIANSGASGEGIVLKPGMVIAIEPITISNDKRLSAHFEHTIAILAGGPIILSEPG